MVGLDYARCSCRFKVLFDTSCNLVDAFCNHSTQSPADGPLSPIVVVQWPLHQQLLKDRTLGMDHSTTFNTAANYFAVLHY